MSGRRRRANSPGSQRRLIFAARAGARSPRPSMTVFLALPVSVKPVLREASTHSGAAMLIHPFLATNRSPVVRNTSRRHRGIAPGNSANRSSPDTVAMGIAHTNTKRTWCNFGHYPLCQHTVPGQQSDLNNSTRRYKLITVSVGQRQATTPQMLTGAGSESSSAAKYNFANDSPARIISRSNRLCWKRQ
jgi:hypothetical protein